MAAPHEPMPYHRHGSHLPMLEREVRAAGPGARILELGCGDASTPKLVRWSRELGQQLYSVENVDSWRPPSHHAGHFVFRSLDEIDPGVTFAVALVDSAPARARGAIGIQLMLRAHVLVMHDTEIEHRSLYGWRDLFEALDAYGWTREVHTCRWTQIETTVARRTVYE